MKFLVGEYTCALLFHYYIRNHSWSCLLLCLLSRKNIRTANCKTSIKQWVHSRHSTFSFRPPSTIPLVEAPLLGMPSMAKRLSSKFSDKPAEPDMAEEIAALCPKLTYTQRLYGFVTCFVIGLFFSLFSFVNFVKMLQGEVRVSVELLFELPKSA